jgi:hypothetical protein
MLTGGGVSQSKGGGLAKYLRSLALFLYHQTKTLRATRITIERVSIIGRTTLFVWFDPLELALKGATTMVWVTLLVTMVAMIGSSNVVRVGVITCRD